MSVDGAASAGVDGIAAPAAGSGLDDLPDFGGLGGTFNFSEHDALSSLLSQSGLAPSPESTRLEHDYMDGNTALGQGDISLFDQFLSEPNEASEPTSMQEPGATGHVKDQSDSWISLFSNPEVRVPSENSDLQPRPGASSCGCDAGGLAVSF